MCNNIQPCFNPNDYYVVILASKARKMTGFSLSFEGISDRYWGRKFGIFEEDWMCVCELIEKCERNRGRIIGQRFLEKLSDY